MASENALKEFKTTHAEQIAATKAEFVKFLRDGDLPEEALDLVALYIYICNRSAQRDNPGRGPTPAGEYFAAVVEDGFYDYIEFWDNPKRHAALMPCPACDGEGHVPKAAAPRLKTKKGGRVRGV